MTNTQLKEITLLTFEAHSSSSFYISNYLLIFIILILTLSEHLLKKLKLEHKPQQIYNCDETGISGHVATREKAYGTKGIQLHQKKARIQ